MPDDVCVLVVERNGVELDLQEELALIPENIPFNDPSFVADDVKDAIIEAKQSGGINFSFHRIETTITIPAAQTMVVPQLEIEVGGELILDGELYLI